MTPAPAIAGKNIKSVAGTNTWIATLLLVAREDDLRKPLNVVPHPLHPFFDG